nr:sarcosine oxidase subunit gamma family protein [Neoroseomonas alba]
MLRRGQDAAFAEAMRGAFGMEPPAPGHTATGQDATAIWIQPGQWLLTAPRGVEGALAARATAAFTGFAAVADQSHGRTTILLSGAAAREALSRGCRLDLHPRAFGPGRAASTPIAQIGCLLHQTDATPSFELTVFSTLAEPFLHWLIEATAPLGVDIA